MEALNPMLEFLFLLIVGIKNGTPLSCLLEGNLNSNCEVSREFKIWWLNHQNREDKKVEFSTDHRLILSEILESGLHGGSILQHLEDLFAEVHQLNEEKCQNYLEQLPFRLMLPLVLFFFPGILLLLFGPLLGQIYLEIIQ